MILYITAGECLDELLKIDGSVPFNEAIIQGECDGEIFSEAFIIQRCKSLNVSKEIYQEKLSLFFQKINQLDHYEQIKLCFGKDPFCIINILVLLAYLEKLQYNGKIIIQFYDEYSGSIQNSIDIQLGSYQNIYQKVMIRHLYVQQELEIFDNGIKEYLNSRGNIYE